MRTHFNFILKDGNVHHETIFFYVFLPFSTFFFIFIFFIFVWVCFRRWIRSSFSLNIDWFMIDESRGTHRTRRQKIIFCLRMLASSFSYSRFGRLCTVHTLILSIFHWLWFHPIVPRQQTTPSEINTKIKVRKANIALSGAYTISRRWPRFGSSIHTQLTRRRDILQKALSKLCAWQCSPKRWNTWNNQIHIACDGGRSTTSKIIIISVT